MFWIYLESTLHLFLGRNSSLLCLLKWTVFLLEKTKQFYLFPLVCALTLSYIRFLIIKGYLLRYRFKFIGTLKNTLKKWLWLYNVSQYPRKVYLSYLLHLHKFCSNFKKYSFVLILRRNFRLVLADSQSVPGIVTAIVLMIAFGEEFISLQISSTH